VRRHEVSRASGERESTAGAAGPDVSRSVVEVLREEPDAKQIIKSKEIYQLLESVTDKCEDVANLIEGIVLENA